MNEIKNSLEKHLSAAIAEKNAENPQCTQQYSDGFSDGEIFVLKKLIQLIGEHAPPALRINMRNGNYTFAREIEVLIKEGYEMRYKNIDWHKIPVAEVASIKVWHTEPPMGIGNCIPINPPSVRINMRNGDYIWAIEVKLVELGHSGEVHYRNGIGWHILRAQDVESIKGWETPTRV